MKVNIPLIKRNLPKVAVVAIIWYVSTVVFLFVEKGVMGDLKYYPSTGNKFDFSTALVFNPLFSLVVGGLLGIVEIFWLGNRFRKNSFGQKLLYKTLFYLFAIMVLTFVGTAIANAISLERSIFSEAVLNSVLNFFGDFAYISIMFYIGFILIGTLFFLEVSDNLGQGVLMNFLVGKYHQPREEERVFMFMDLKSSTTIAEQLGHVRYFSWLNDYYNDITNPILSSYGTIHQYVGDEVILSWSKKEGVQNLNCIRCFFHCRQKIAELRKNYQEEYGIVPEFKAGLHIGRVTVGEIGTIKKEIAYTGDVLNTTSRIQGLCNSLQTDILISEDLLDAFGKDLEVSFEVKEIGEVALRGRNQEVKVFTVTMKPV